MLALVFYGSELLVVEVPFLLNLLNLFDKELVIVESLGELRFKGVNEVSQLGLPLLVYVVAWLLKGSEGI